VSLVERFTENNMETESKKITACANCYQAHESSKFERVRVGDDENGWGIILLKGCPDHIKIAMDKLS
jgi:hypothetical protein